MSGNYGIGYTVNTGEPFYFDLEDYEKVNKYRWSARHRTEHGRNKEEYYIEDSISKKRIHLHHLVLNYDDITDINIPIIDHINNVKYDCRKDNLRIADDRINNINKRAQKSNTTGIIGVNYNTATDKWVARICPEKNKRICLYQGNSFEKAILARLNAELEYYGILSPQKHLFEKYRIGKGGDISG